MSWEFDGEYEISRKLERGQSFGFSKDQYNALAHISMAALRWAGVEPSEINLLSSGEPGCDVILYGSAYQYTIRMQPARECSTLFAIPLDSNLGPGVELYVHKFRETDYVGGILATILAQEGVPMTSTLKTAEEYLRDQNAEYL